MAFIEAKEVKLQAILSNAQEAYKIPLYQRTYTWSKDQWEDLFEDICEIMGSSNMHFLGSIVVVPEGEHRLGVNYFSIIDGQQRLATLLIWLSAIRDKAKESNNEELAKHITDTFLFAKEWENSKQKYIPKLELGSLDNDIFKDILYGDKPIKQKNHQIYECYNYFKKNTSLDVWQYLINNISIVHINAFNYFNAFRLFETLNDRGLELSAADLIKNFLLMKASSDERIFADTIAEWNQMYENIRDKEPVKFILRYILANYKGKISEAKLYEEVSNQLKDKQPEDIFNFVNKLNSSSTIYKKIVDAEFSSEKVNKKLKELRLIEVAPSFTLLLKVMPFYEEGRISENDILDIMNMIEVFHIRWGVCSQATAKLYQIYNEICIDLANKNPSNFKGFIKQKLSQEINNNVDDEIFKRSFTSKSFKPNEQRTKYILWKLSKPTGETILNLYEIQTEHIMPQVLSEGWISYLRNKMSKSYQEVMALHAEYIDRIGNLTIIKGNWNRSMSNKLFKDKKNEYSKSEFSITKDIVNYNEWSIDEINDRSIKLANLAMKIWEWK